MDLAVCVNRADDRPVRLELLGARAKPNFKGCLSVHANSILVTRSRRRRVHTNRFRRSIARSVCRIANLEESLSGIRGPCRSPLAHWLCSPSGADAVAVRSRPRASGGGGHAKRGDQVILPDFGDAGLEFASSSTKKGPRSWENCSDWH